MNNQITILDRNNQSIIVDLICYFSFNNKKYIFYNKNEIVQDGLIKMYVSEENNGFNTDITPEDWINLKKVMQEIITGNTNVQFLSYSNPVIFNEPKAIALNDSNINTIKNAYKNVVNVNQTEPVLNKDILVQNFGNNKDVSSSVDEPVQITSIPNVQNNFNMEATPVNLNMEMPVIEPISSVSDNSTPIVTPSLSVPNLDVENNMPTIEPINSGVNGNTSIPNLNDEVPGIGNNNIVEEPALNINNIKPGGIDSGFRVSNEPNIFDNPSMAFSISEEEINDNSFSENESVKIDSVKQNIKSDNSKLIELNERKIKLFEELANIYKEENDLLKQDSSSDLEKTASNLFDSNGSLNVNEVLN